METLCKISFMATNTNQYYSLNLGSIEIKQTNQSFYRRWNRLHRFQKTLIILVFILFCLYIITHVEFHSNQLKNIPSNHEHITKKKSGPEELKPLDPNLVKQNENNNNNNVPNIVPVPPVPPVVEEPNPNEHNQNNQNPAPEMNEGEKKNGLLDKLIEPSKNKNYEPKAIDFKGPTNERQKGVVDMFVHAWKGYKEFAWGQDELKPISKTYSSWFNLGLTIVDSLDTMYIMGLKEQFKEARDWVETSLNLDIDRYNNLFEITIRIMGGLLSAFHLSGDKVFLDKAYDLGNRSMSAFDTRSGIPLSDINLGKRQAKSPSWTSDSSVAEVATLQIEFKELAYATKDERFRHVAEKISENLHNLHKPNGLVPIYINPHTGNFVGHTITLGARGDSYYEYLLKQWVQNGANFDKTKDKEYFLLEDWLESVKGVQEKLVRQTKPNNYTFVGELLSDSYSPKMDHLVCFLPGNLALGAKFLAKNPEAPKEQIENLMNLAKQMTETCYQMYAQMQTGLSPEICYFNTFEGSTADLYVKEADRHNLLRPETVESLYYMYKITGEKKYQDYGWKIFESFEKYTKVENGYTSIGDVTNVNSVRPRDKMESFFLAETLKYFYLLFEDQSNENISLDKWVFNTEAHLLPLRN